MSFLISDSIICSLGLSTSEVLVNIESANTGITNTSEYSKITPAPISLIDRNAFNERFSSLFKDQSYTFFEQIAIASIDTALNNTDANLTNADTLLIISTTKGNIELINSTDEEVSQDGLVASAATNIGNYFNCKNSPQVVCNACISGVLALNMAHRYIQNGDFKHVVVTGADIASDFVVAGFESFKSMSSIPCQPFDKNRTGLSLGEGAGTLVLSKESPSFNKIRVVGGSSANDANHISGPSRTGEGAYLSAKRALGNIESVDFISAHGTATPYNDDMESKAITRLALQETPTNSFKGYIGHTLGAAGVIESILTLYSMINNKLFMSLGMKEQGLAEPLNIITKHSKQSINRALKLASGFGGCNAAIVFKKDE